LRDDSWEPEAGRARGPSLTIDFEGRAVSAFGGESVGVALFAGGIQLLGRSSKYHRPRGIFCLDGHCASCYLRIDGQPNRRACMTPVREGLRCERQNAFPSADVDLLQAADWLFPEGMDHHTLMTGTRVGNQLFLKLVRQMGGSGTLPDAPAAELPDITDVDADLCVVGGGPAGLTAARAVAEAAPRARVVLFDEQAAAGGSLSAEAGGPARGAELAGAARRAGVRVVEQATAVGYFPEDRGGALAVVTAAGLCRVSARRFLYATGAYDQSLPFIDNDRPGILSARACGRLLFQHGLRPVRAGRRVAILAGDGQGAAAAALGSAFTAAKVDVEQIDLARERVIAARGTQAVRGLEIGRAAGARSIMTETRPDTRLVKCDLVAVATLPAPASELARQHGAAVAMDRARGGFAVTIDDRFRSSAAGVFACGDVTGFAGTQAAARSGAAAGRAIADDLLSSGSRP
jgi:sarcosine oxidase subunit alpha